MYYMYIDVPSSKWSSLSSVSIFLSSASLFIFQMEHISLKLSATSSWSLKKYGKSRPSVRGEGGEGREGERGRRAGGSWREGGEVVEKKRERREEKEGEEGERGSRERGEEEGGRGKRRMRGGRVE